MVQSFAVPEMLLICVIMLMFIRLFVWEMIKMDLYTWKDHYAVSFEMMDNSNGFEQFRISNQTGVGSVTACTVFSGIQVLFNNLKMLQCSNRVKQNKKIIEMSFCLEGRYENSWNDRYSFILSAGDFSVGFAVRKEGGGRFPLRSYKGILLILDAEAFSEFHSNILRELEINLDGIVSLASRQPHYFKLRSNEELNVILNSIVSGFAGRNIPLLRIKVLELLLFLSSPDTTDLKELPAYLNKKNVALAKAVYAALTQDLSRHLTLEQLAAEFDSGITSLKSHSRVFTASPFTSI